MGVRRSTARVHRWILHAIEPRLFRDGKLLMWRLLNSLQGRLTLLLGFASVAGALI